jgi:hypothetical protein
MKMGLNWGSLSSRGDGLELGVLARAQEAARADRLQWLAITRAR